MVLSLKPGVGQNIHCNVRVCKVGQKNKGLLSIQGIQTAKLISQGEPCPE